MHNIDSYTYSIYSRIVPQLMWSSKCTVDPVKIDMPETRKKLFVTNICPLTKISIIQKKKSKYFQGPYIHWTQKSQYLHPMEMFYFEILRKIN